MSKKKSIDWLKVFAGATIIAITVGDTPLIPDEIIGVPSGLVLIADGLRWL